MDSLVGDDSSPVFGVQYAVIHPSVIKFFDIKQSRNIEFLKLKKEINKQLLANELMLYEHKYTKSLGRLQVQVPCS